MEETVSVAILLNNEHIPKEIFKSYVDDYFGPQLEDFKESSLSVCILSEKTGLIASKNNVATFVKSQWLFLTSCKLNEIFEFKLVICENQNWNIIASEDMTDGRLIQTFETSSDNVIVVHIEWNKPHTVSVESILELHSMDESLLKSHYETQEASETFINLETITEDNNDDESLLDSLQEESDKNEAECKLDSSDTDISLEPEKNVYSNENTADDSVTNENYNDLLQDQMVKSELNDSLEQIEKNNSQEVEVDNKNLLNEYVESNKKIEDVDDANLEDSPERQIQDNQNKKARKAIMLTKIQSILVVKSELDRINKDSRLYKTNDTSLENQLTDVESLESKVHQENDPQYSDVPSKIENEESITNEDQSHEMDDDSVFNPERQLYEEENTVNFPEQSVPINCEKEEFAKDSIYFNDRELHELDITDQFPNDNKSVKLMNLQDSELSQEQILSNTEELSLHNENMDIADESLENESISKTYEMTDENQRSEFEENLENQNITEIVNNSQVEEEIGSSISNINNLDQNDLEDTNFTNANILQPVSCIMVSSQHEAQEIETLESPVVANAVEDLHIVDYQEVASNFCTNDDSNFLSPSIYESEHENISPNVVENKQPNIMEHVNTNIDKSKIQLEKGDDLVDEEENFTPNNEMEESQSMDLINTEDNDIKEDENSVLTIPKLNLENPDDFNVEISEIKNNLNDNLNINKSDDEDVEDDVDDSNVSEENMKFSETTENQSETHLVLSSSPTNNVDINDEIKLKNGDANETMLINNENNKYENQEEVSVSNNFGNPHPHDYNISIQAELSETNLVNNSEPSNVINGNNEEETVQIRKKEKEITQSNDTEEHIVTDTKTDELEEGVQPRVSDIIEKFEVLQKDEVPQKQEEMTNKIATEKEKEKHRVSDIIKKFEDINIENVDDNKNLENENKKRHSKISNKNIESKIQELYHEKELKTTSRTYQEYQNPKFIQNGNDLINFKETSKHVDNTSKDIDPEKHKENKAELGVNDDYKYPDSVTPTKVEHGLSNLKEYDVLFMDDDVFNKDNMSKELRDSIMIPCTSTKDDSLTPVTEISIKNTPKASIETLEESEIEKVKQSIEAQTPEPKRKGIMNLCGCMGGRKRS